MQVRMNYGRDGLTLNLPDHWEVTVIEKKPMPLIADPAAAIAQALEQPVGCGSLAEEAKGKRNACIVICDITRPVPNGLLLPPLVRGLMEAGMKQDNIRILVATGLHRPNRGEELREVIGDDWVFENITIENHYARRDEDHVDLGHTSQGTPLKLDRRVVEAELRIMVGLVEPHFMAGYSGGRKLIMPGVAHLETITYLHNAGFMEHPQAANCVLEGNPLHEQQLEIVELLGGALAVNVVIDHERRLGFVNFGEVVASHLQAVDFVREYAEVTVPKRFKTVVTSSAGYPLDKTYYQTVKGMVAAMGILEPGGDLFIVSEILEGMGSPEYIEAQKKLVEMGAEGFFKHIEPLQHAGIDAWQTQKQLGPMRIGNIHLHTQGLSEAEHGLTGVNRVHDLESALHDSAGEHRQVAVIPEGPYVLPFVQD